MQTKLSLEERINQKIREIDATAQEMPGVVIVHNMQDLTIRYMSKRGLDTLGVTQQELIEMGQEYHSRFFNAEETKEQVPKMIGLLERNNNEEIIALFQQVRPDKHQPWNWYCTSVKILMRDDEDKPLLTIAIAIPIDPEHNITHKVSRLLEENNFLRKNNAKFRELSNRERILLKYFALGKTSAEVASELHLSILTVNTHRKNIKQKLGTNNVYDLAEYARAFDLI